jgi:hypothetical protein
MIDEAVFEEVQALAAEIKREMDRAERERRIPESIERWCALKDARRDLLSDACRAFIGMTVFDGDGESIQISQFEYPEYRDAVIALAKDLPQSISRAQAVLAGGAR